MPARHQTGSSYRRDTSSMSSQAGLSTIAMVAILVVIGIVFISIFLFASAGGSKKDTGTKSSTTSGTDDPATTVSKEPAFIRLPENSMSYKSKTYGFSFAYPSGFAELTETTAGTAATANTPVFRAESLPASKKPVGNGGAVLTGAMGAYVYKKDTFKILVVDPDVFAGGTKTGNDTTWKIVSAGTSTAYAVGTAYPAKSTKSQTGIPVFNFSLNTKNAVYGRYVFDIGQYYVIVALPYVSKPDGSALTASDIAAYNIIGANLGSTVRVPSVTNAVSPSGNSSTSTSTDSSGFAKPN